jgi:hypothetical protein
MKRACCNPVLFKEQMSALDSHGQYDTPPPEGFAIWRLTPSKYNPKAEAHGGILFPCLPSPPMVVLDNYGNCFAVQDQSPSILRIDATTNTAEQLGVPFPKEMEQMRMTGPAICKAPDGAIWFTLLGHHNALVRVCPDSMCMVLHSLGPPPEWCKVLRLIHCNFDGIAANDHTDDNQLFCLSSSLVDHTSVNAVVMFRFSDDWQTVIGRRVIPLPTQDCACHRVEIIGNTDKPEDRSVVVTELASSKLYQMKIENVDEVEEISRTDILLDTLNRDGTPHIQANYTPLGEADGDRC